MQDLFKELKRSLEEWLEDAEKVAVLGIGNLYRKDDGIGSLVVQKLEEYGLPKNVGLFNCETVPENFTHLIKSFNPTHIILIDSALLNQRSGMVKLVFPEDIGGLAISTHTLPLTLFVKYLEQFIKTKIVLLAIQPKDVDFGFGLTSELENTLTNLVEIIVEVFLKKFSRKSFKLA